MANQRLEGKHGIANKGVLEAGDSLSNLSVGGREKRRESRAASGDMAPFPYLPMVAIMASLLSLLIAEMGVFSYAGYMVEYLGVVDNKDQAGYYAGFLSSAYMIGNMFSSHFWGLVADRHGSRFVILCGLSSISILSISFGLSKTFTWAFLSRLVLGLLDGMMTAAKTIVTEVCGTEHSTVCMGLLTSAFSLGAVLGPGVGGMLAEPARYYPQTFSEGGIFGRNPYLLSNLVGAGLAFVALPLVYFFLQDTKREEGSRPTPTAWYPSWLSFGRKNDGGDDVVKKGSSEPDHAAEAAEEKSSTSLEEYGVRKPSWMQPGTMPPTVGKTGSGRDAVGLGQRTGKVKQESLLAQRHIRVLLFTDAVYSASFSGFDEVYALWALSTTAKGGLDWSSLQLGQVFFACGFMVLVFELVAVPYLTPWLGVRLSQRIGSVCEVPVYFLFPLLSSANDAGYTVTVPVLILLFMAYVCTNSFYVAIALAVNNATGPDRRGEINGLSMTCTSLARSISPILFSSLFAYSINSSHPYPFDHHLVFYLLALTRLLAAWLGWSRISDVGNME